MKTSSGSMLSSGNNKCCVCGKNILAWTGDIYKEESGSLNLTERVYCSKECYKKGGNQK